MSQFEVTLVSFRNSVYILLMRIGNPCRGEGRVGEGGGERVEGRGQREEGRRERSSLDKW